MEEKRAYLLKTFIALNPSKHNAIEESITLLTFFFVKLLFLNFVHH